MPSYDQNVEAPAVPGQQATNPQLLNEGYPGIASPQSSFQPPSDGSALGTNAAPNSQLASLSKDVLLGTITQLPTQDLASFFQGLPQAEQTQISTIMQNPNAKPQDLLNQLNQFPTTDLAQGLSLLPTADVQQALSTAQQTLGAASGDASTGTLSGGTATGGDASAMQPAYNPDGSVPTTDTSGLATQPGMTTDTSGLATQPGTTTDASGLATQPQAQADGTGQQSGGSGDNAALLNKLSTLNPAELSSVISKLPQQDLSTFFQALPSADQQQIQSALSSNQNPTPQDLATAMEKLPTQDLLAAASAVPANDFASLFTDSSAAKAAPKPGGSEFPLILGLTGAGLLGYAGYRRGAFEKVPDLFQKLTGRLDGHAPSWMSNFGKGGADVAEGAIPGVAEAGIVSPLAADGVSLAEKAATLAKAGSEIGTAAEAISHAGPVAEILGDAIEVAKVVPK